MIIEIFDKVKLIESIGKHKAGECFTVIDITKSSFRLSNNVDVIYAASSQFKKVLKFDVGHLKELQRQRKEFNDTDLSEIELYEDGKLLVLDPDVLKEWHYMGLSNMDYVMSDVYNTTKTMWEAVDDNPRNLVSKT